MILIYYFLTIVMMYMIRILKRMVNIILYVFLAFEMLQTKKTIYKGM